MTRLALLAAALAAVVLALPAAADTPILTLPGSITAEATGPDGAVVSYQASAQTDTGDPLVVSCSPPGAQATGTLDTSAQFPLGTTTVSCTASDSSGGELTSGSFGVTVVDTTPPALTLPGDMTVEGDASGAAVSYVASAVDLVDGSVAVDCAPASGSTFPVGTTTVACSATDSHGNSANGSFSVTVTDGSGGGGTTTTDTTSTAPTTTETTTSTDSTSSTTDTSPTTTGGGTTGGPTFAGVPGPLTIEATDASGARVEYTPPTATGVTGEPLSDVVCTPRPGSTFPLGTTTVVCTASDAGTTASVSFTVTIVDTAPPAISVPDATSVYATGPSGIAATDPAAAAFLGAAVAHDAVDPAPTLSNDAPAVFPLGATTVRWVARDRSGNTSSRSSTLTVLSVPPGTTPPPLPPPVVHLPPPDVSGFAATRGHGFVRLRWRLPPGADHVVLSRSDAAAGSASLVLYQGRHTSYLDRRVADGHLYRYEIAVFDATGVGSVGVALLASPQPARLLAPADGALLRRPPVLMWRAVSNASYYNVQLYRGTVKVMSVWPGTHRLRIAARWRFRGRSFRLVPGRYEWYVWPGYGPHARRDYGPLLGRASFRVSG